MAVATGFFATAMLNHKNSLAGRSQRTKPGGGGTSTTNRIGKHGKLTRLWFYGQANLILNLDETITRP